MIPPDARRDEQLAWPELAYRQMAGITTRALDRGDDRSARTSIRDTVPILERMAHLVGADRRVIEVTKISREVLEAEKARLAPN